MSDSNAESKPTHVVGPIPLTQGDGAPWVRLELHLPAGLGDETRRRLDDAILVSLGGLVTAAMAAISQTTTEAR